MRLLLSFLALSMLAVKKAVNRVESISKIAAQNVDTYAGPATTGLGKDQQTRAKAALIPMKNQGPNHSHGGLLAMVDTAVTVPIVMQQRPTSILVRISWPQLRAPPPARHLLPIAKAPHTHRQLLRRQHRALASTREIEFFLWRGKSLLT